MKENIIWRGKRNESVYDAVRIPGIIITSKGTLIVYAEGRNYGNILGPWGDWAAMDLIIKRSTDNGDSWSETKVLCNGTNAEVSGGLRAMASPVLFADGDTVHAVYSVQSGVESRNGGVYYIKSENDGVTWSEPRNISASCHTDEYDRCLFVAGPGHGIVLSEKSRNPGMLFAPVWMTPAIDGSDTHHHPSVVSTLYSLDKGNTWQIGKIIYAAEDMPDPNETVAVELSDGRVMLNMRNESARKRRAVTVSETGYDNWSVPYFDETLIDPVCFGSIARYDKDMVLFVNCASDSSRTNLTVRASCDNGKTWKASRIIAAKAGYADIAVGRDGIIYVLYEIDAGSTSMNLLRFDLDWIYGESI